MRTACCHERIRVPAAGRPGNRAAGRGEATLAIPCSSASGTAGRCSCAGTARGGSTAGTGPRPAGRRGRVPAGVRRRARLGPVATGAAVSLLAVTSAVVQPLAGRARDAGRLPDAGGMAAGLALTAAGLASPRSASPRWQPAPRPVGSARPWAPPRSAASSATPAPPPRRRRGHRRRPARRAAGPRRAARRGRRRGQPAGPAAAPEQAGITARAGPRLAEAREPGSCGPRPPAVTVNLSRRS